MEKVSYGFLLIALYLIINALSVNAQCTDKFTQEEVLNGYRFEEKKPETAKVKDPKPAEPEKIYTHVFATFDGPERFKISLDTDLNSGFSKANDYVVFTILENVYGTGKIPGKTPGKILEKRCVIIPKGTKIYGNVDYSRSRYPFSIGGKAKLFVTVKNIKLEDGTEIDISFAEPPNQTLNQPPIKNIIRECKHYDQRKCIEGRRSKLTLPSPVVGAATGASLLLLKDEDTTGTIALLSFIESLSKVTGIDSLVNPPNAELKAKMIFDVVLEKIDSSHTIGVWVPLKKAEEPKKDDKEDKDK